MNTVTMTAKKTAPAKFEAGDIFEPTNQGERNDFYILAHVSMTPHVDGSERTKVYAAINLATGNRFRDPSTNFNDVLKNLTFVARGVKISLKLPK